MGPLFFLDGGDRVQGEEDDDARVSMSLDVDWGLARARPYGTDLVRLFGSWNRG